MEAMEITSDAMRIRLATLRLEGESQILWDWVRVSRDPEMMTWGEFRELFMGKFFSASTRHAKAREFLKLKQGNMTELEYVAKFTELARFEDDYVATNMAKVQKFEDGLKLSIRGKIVGFLLQDMDSIVRTAMTIEREIEDAWSIQDAGAMSRGMRISLLLVRERSKRLLFHEDFRDEATSIKANAIIGLLASQN